MRFDRWILKWAVKFGLYKSKFKIQAIKSSQNVIYRLNWIIENLWRVPSIEANKLNSVRDRFIAVSKVTQPRSSSTKGVLQVLQVASHSAGSYK